MSINIPKKRVESLEGSLDSKQNKLVAGQGISIDDTDPKNPIISSTGGSSGTSDYTQLENKPRINSVILEGNKTAKDLSIFDSTTLVAGKNVTIDEVLPEGGIDQHTLACWHFDEDKLDVVNNESWGETYATIDNTVGKFNNSLKYSGYGFKTNISAISLEEFTMDGWIWSDYTYGWKAQFGTGSYVSNYTSITDLMASFTKSSVTLGVYRGTQQTFTFPSELELYKWYHIAFQKKGETLTFYIDGKIVATMIWNVPITSEFSFFGSNIHFDEIRISNIARYADNFIPPTQPYSKSESTGKWKINSSSEPLAPATMNNLGGIKVGTGLSITEDGTLNNESYSSNDFTTPLKVKLQGIEENANNFSTSFNPETNTLIFSKGVK